MKGNVGLHKQRVISINNFYFPKYIPADFLKCKSFIGRTCGYHATKYEFVRLVIITEIKIS